MMSSRLCMVMDDLEQVMFCVLEHHEDTFVFQDDFNQTNDIHMTELGAQRHLSHS